MKPTINTKQQKYNVVKKIPLCKYIVLFSKLKANFPVELLKCFFGSIFVFLTNPKSVISHMKLQYVASFSKTQISYLKLPISDSGKTQKLKKNRAHKDRIGV